MKTFCIIVSVVATLATLALAYIFFSAKGANKVSIDNIEEYCIMQSKLAGETARADALVKCLMEATEKAEDLRGNLRSAETKIRELEQSRLSPSDVASIRTALESSGCDNKSHQWELDIARKHVCPTAPVAPDSNELVILRARCENQALLLDRARTDAEKSRVDATAWRGHKCASSAPTTIVVPGVDLSPPATGCNNIRALFPADDRNIVNWDRHFVDWNYGDATTALQKILREAKTRKIAGHYCIDFVLPAQ